MGHFRKTIGAVALVAVCISASAACGGVRPGKYCSRDEVTTSSGDDLGEFAADAEIRQSGSTLTLSFSNGMPDSGQVVQTGRVALRPMPKGGFSFAFTDNWGAKGVGTLKQRRSGIRVDIKRTTEATDDWGNNAGRNYGAVVLHPAPCRSAR